MQKQTIKVPDTHVTITTKVRLTGYEEVVTQQEVILPWSDLRWHYDDALIQSHTLEEGQ